MHFCLYFRLHILEAKSFALDTCGEFAVKGFRARYVKLKNLQIFVAVQTNRFPRRNLADHRLPTKQVLGRQRGQLTTTLRPLRRPTKPFRSQAGRCGRQKRRHPNELVSPLKTVTHWECQETIPNNSNWLKAWQPKQKWGKSCAAILTY